jgi:hypothetical protein
VENGSLPGAIVVRREPPVNGREGPKIKFGAPLLTAADLVRL